MEPEIDEVLERAHFRSVVAAFRNYKAHSLQRISKSEKIIAKLPENHQRRLEKYKTYLGKFRKCVEVNNHIVQQIIQDVETMFENVDHSNTETNGNGTGHEADYVNGSFDPINIEKQHKVQHDVEKVQSVLKNLVRDWSDMGAAEREQCYKPIIDEIIERFPPSECQPSSIKVLVPGAGLGRLAWEVAARGYTCQGNEFSLFMLFASNLVLNRTTEVNKYTIHPWLHQYVNNLTCSHQVLGARVPDVLPASDAHEHNLSMAAGDFLKVYTEADEWHCVATCFFIDCAPNVIEFIENIYKILRPGGVWVNLGPLLYHYSDLTTEDSIEPPYDILLDIIKDVGFIILKEKTGVKTKYAQNPNSMLQHEYDSVFFVCQKPTQ
ncbi:carnosine N-methyltransferase [Plutella xylostella]|uniref:carnosine N-methyltransferase n=1 Tax=Plutella xylostella TaxID=51655 RepID=UPI00203286A3|nr:carnosine N-methyltransferase [Plutella xylostella]XP_037968914.2 carnosine N-methyltransferase [Plutella xylostella]